jgi:uncharacterized protein (TIGR02466 family)
MNIKPAFIAPLFCFNINNEDLIKKLEKEAYIQEKNKNGRLVSNQGGFQSEHIYNDNDVVKSFFNEVTPCVEKIKNKIRFNSDLNLTGLWFNINRKNDFNLMHCHPNAFLSAAFYIKCSNKTGDIVFENPDKNTVFFNTNNDDFKNDSCFSNFFTHTPSVGDLIFFYGWLNHRVRTNLSDEDRISLSFNVTTYI